MDESSCFTPYAFNAFLASCRVTAPRSNASLAILLLCVRARTKCRPRFQPPSLCMKLTGRPIGSAHILHVYRRGGRHLLLLQLSLVIRTPKNQEQEQGAQ